VNIYETYAYISILRELRYMRVALKLASAGGIVEIANNLLEAVCYNYCTDSLEYPKY
jgi:hypothetical protein